MKIIKYLLFSSKWLIAVAILASVASALAGISVIAMINDMISSQRVNNVSLAYGGLMLGLLFLTGLISQLLLIRMGHRVVYQLRMIMIKRVLDADLAQIEKIGGAALYASLTKDISKIGSAFNATPFVIYNSVLLISGFAYMGMLSWQLFCFSLAIFTLGVGVSQILMIRMKALMKIVRETDDTIFQGYEGAIDGNCEMKLNHQRSERFYFDDFDPAASKARDVEIKADTYWVFSRNWAVTLILGLICSLFPLGVWVGIDTDVVVGFVLVLMFLRTPINDLMSDIPSIINANVSLQKIDSLVLPDYSPEFEQQPSSSYSQPGKELLVFESVKYGYSTNKDEYAFQLGPVDLSIKAGEVIFIIGGNGSGKSTLAKLLTGLYTASSGEIRLNGEALTRQNLTWYRSHFSTVFSTFYLFERLVGPDGRLDTKLAQAFLIRLKMDHKVTIAQQKISTTRLSQGQRKRMALLLAYVEERPIWLLDEWAADQDPSFRAYFYLELLPELKRMGKTIIAISHDDHYFHTADRIFKCDSGEMVLFQGNVDGVARQAVKLPINGSLPTLEEA